MSETLHTPESKPPYRLSRRTLLKSLAGAAAGITLESCGSGENNPNPTPLPTAESTPLATEVPDCAIVGKEHLPMDDPSCIIEPS